MPTFLEVEHAGRRWIERFSSRSVSVVDRQSVALPRRRTTRRHRSPVGTSSKGFTIIELLVVVGVIGILIALLLPALQHAREAARKAQCANKVKQLATAFHTHHDAQGHFPVNGAWSDDLAVFRKIRLRTGDPDRGFGQDQPGSWLYNLLPYIEQGALHDLGAGMTGDQKKRALTLAMETPIGAVICPSRRAVRLYPYIPAVYPGVRSNTGYDFDPENAFVPAGVAKTDFEANAGESGDFKGIVSTRSNKGEAVRLIRLKDIKDGASMTYSVGEKFMWSHHYTDASQDYFGQNNSWVDALSCLMPDGMAVIGATCRNENEGLPPKRDHDASVPFFIYDTLRFGSAHPGSCNMGFCDGSVRAISYDIHPDVHRRYGSRDDGMPAESPDILRHRPCK